jgi:hypothetical protein
MRWSAVTLPLTALLVGLPIGAAQAGTDTPITAYDAPPFADACQFHRFGEGEAPDLSAYPDDPLCVEYAKRDITVDNGGALAFALAEPARVALAAGKCQYWQVDHWSVQFSRGNVPVIRWDGSYWFDRGTGQAAGRLRHLTVGGQPAGIDEAARLVDPVSPELASYLRGYGHGGSGIGVDGGVRADPSCAR